MSSNEMHLFFAAFFRICGFFLISPLFSKKNIPFYVRVGFALFCTIVLTPQVSLQVSLPSFPLLLAIKELAIGYLLGVLFALIFEAAALAGQLIGVMSGFSAVELVDPIAQKNGPLSLLFSLIIFLFFLSADLHHLLLRLLFNSFTLLPPTLDFASLPLNLVMAAGKLFAQAMHYAMIPMLFLALLLTLFAILSRFLPEVPIFWIGFPLQILVGFFALSFGMAFFNQILIKAFYDILSFAKTLFFSFSYI